jgi:8-hydroxy-5-deazaflavin:NADPH oxidoreductase
MKIGILGAGKVGSALGKRLSDMGHEVRYGVRNPEGRDACGTLVEAVAFGEVVINALPWRAAETELPGLGLSGRVLIDCSNPIGWDNGPKVIARGAETLAASTGALLCKAWSTCGAEHIHARDIEVHMAGHDDAKAVIRPLVEAMGQHPVDCGGVLEAHRLEEMASLWIHLSSVGEKGRNWTFRTRSA